MTEEILKGLAKPEYVLAVCLLFGAGRLVSRVADRFLTLVESKLTEVVASLGDIRQELTKVQEAVKGLEHRVDKIENA